MRRYLLDSNAVTDFVNRREPLTTRVRQVRLRGDRIGTCEPVIAELFYGLEFSSSRAENTVRLERGLSQIRSWPFERKSAREYGRIAAELRRRGRKMQVVDMMLAAIALTVGDGVVVTTDSDLIAIPGLTVENWTIAAEGETP
jgi:tRNA(fMet)-specific endonuclease VapC